MLVFAWGLAAVEAQTLQDQLKDTEIAPHWIYDDLPRAKDEARTSGKPLMVVLRCVPCPPGRTLDGQVMQPSPGMEALEKNVAALQAKATAPHPVADKDAMWSEAQKKLTAGQYGDARKDLRAFIQKFAQDAKADDAQFAIGESFFKEKDYAAAIAALKGTTK
jgi:TolA-binding protein